MGNASLPVVLSDRSRTLLAIIAAAARAGAPTPVAPELVEALRAAGHRIGDNPGLIGYELRRLERAGRIAVVGRHRRRVFEIVDTGQRTVLRPKGSSSPALVSALGKAGLRRGAERAGWPRPTRESAASYDEAVRRRDFARDEVTEPSGPVARIGRPVLRSPTGCAAEMMARW